MKELVGDFSVHPLVPGCLLACVMGDPPSRKAQPLDEAALQDFNRLTSLDIVAHFQHLQMLTDEQAAKIIGADNQFVTAFKELVRRIPEVAEVTSCDRKSIERLARALFSARLMAEHLEILTPPELSYEKTAHGTVDLLELLFDSFRKIVGGAWSAFFPKSAFSLVADASAQFWMACLYTNKTEEMTNGFVGLFLMPHRERLQALNQGHEKQSGLHLRDAITEYLDNSREKLSKLHEAVDENVKEGLDRSFAEIVRVVNKLELPALLTFYYESLTRDVCDAFSHMDGTVSSKENRFIQYLVRQISVICDEHSSLGGHSYALAQEKFEEVLAELDELIGLSEVKEKVKQTANFARMQQHRIAQGLKPIPTSYHSVYTGNPGTGKTTVARLMGRIFKALGVLKKGHLIECERSALVGEYVGQTAPRTNAVVDSALDGILFIDEAYSLVKEHEDYGQEAIETLLKRMEDNRDRLIVIVAGYPEEMEKFVGSNPGLHSRFTRFIEFPDYGPQELCRIFTLMFRKNGLTLTPELKEKVLHHFIHLHQERTGNFGNARLVRNCFETVINAQATRLASSGTFDAKALTILDARDLATPAEAAFDEYRRSRKGYVVKCPGCGEFYSWSPDLGIIDAICTNCNRTYSCEFGMPAGQPQ
jgi:predicted DNA-binding protein